MKQVGVAFLDVFKAQTFIAFKPEISKNNSSQIRGNTCDEMQCWQTIILEAIPEQDLRILSLASASLIVQSYTCYEGLVILSFPERDVLKLENKNE